MQFQNTSPDSQQGAYHIEPVILSEADIAKLRTPEVTVDPEATERRYQETCDIFGDILTIEKRGTFRGGICPLDMYSRLRGIDNMFLDLVDNPNMVHTVVDKLVDGHIAMLKSLEEQGALTLGNRNHYAGSGGTGYTGELPQPGYDGTHVRSRDLWGFATDQIFSEVSPAMHEEFALRHEERYLGLFGLNCYGCCEPLHHKLDAVFRYVPRLRRVSISLWADVAIPSEKLQRGCIFSWKPNPAILAGETWDPEQARCELRNFFDATRDNVVEIIMKDTHTVRNKPERMWEWVRIACETARDYA